MLQCLSLWKRQISDEERFEAIMSLPTAFSMRAFCLSSDDVCSIVVARRHKMDLSSVSNHQKANYQLPIELNKSLG